MQYVKKRDNEINYSLNIIKCIAIFAVICIHCRFYHVSSVGSVIDAISRFAVPIFFLISGFFSYYENEDYALSKYRMRIIRLVKIYIVANLAYIIFFLLIGKLTGLNDVISLFSLDSIFGYIIFNLTPGADFLWFISALLYCYILFYIIRKLNFNINSLYVYIPIFLIGNLLLGELSQFLGLTIDFEIYRNFLFMGLPFFTLGYFIHDNKENVTGVLSNSNLIAIMILSLIFTTIETLVVGKHDLYFGIIIFVVCLFIWCVKNPNKLNFKITGWIGKNLYAIMYILHLMVLELFGKFGLELGYFEPVIAFVITALISGVIYSVMKT
ncbi:MAG: acyltransferase [Methanobrevibacter sp.]|uniref:acyltransferase n=1 Tax=Methanobrevibacter sp. TaxID=66852 RepID=UPI0025EF1511|nr:acyltransferase [Methanobrevibacter sp.]MBQ6099363.1 acyltransferase [Methanobrevibacter sp.]